MYTVDNVDIEAIHANARKMQAEALAAMVKTAATWVRARFARTAHGATA